jgi:hypothetical protein
VCGPSIGYVASACQHHLDRISKCAKTFGAHANPVGRRQVPRVGRDEARPAEVSAVMASPGSHTRARVGGMPPTHEFVGRGPGSTGGHGAHATRDCDGCQITIWQMPGVLSGAVARWARSTGRADRTEKGRCRSAAELLGDNSFPADRRCGFAPPAAEPRSGRSCATAALALAINCSPDAVEAGTRGNAGVWQKIPFSAAAAMRPPAAATALLRQGNRFGHTRIDSAVARVARCSSAWSPRMRRRCAGRGLPGRSAGRVSLSRPLPVAKPADVAGPRMATGAPEPGRTPPG